MIVIPKGDRPGLWFAAGAAFLAPLYRKRTLLIDRAKWVYAWTLYNEKIGTQSWLIPSDSNMNLHHAIEINAHSPSGWVFTVPPDLRRKGWLPGSKGIVIFEYSETEANFWTEAAYNEESILESDTS
ncbi:MAG TPA: hypothetical protein VNY80_12555 [Steroidobacteraceae bacterium]|nr:hypothetical protein [Steroidobacteraceae bacterium]